MGDCWILTDLVAPGVIFFCFLVMSLVAFGLLAENRRLLGMQSQAQKELSQAMVPNNGEVKTPTGNPSS